MSPVQAGLVDRVALGVLSDYVIGKDRGMTDGA